MKIKTPRRVDECVCEDDRGSCCYSVDDDIVTIINPLMMTWRLLLVGKLRLSE